MKLPGGVEDELSLAQAAGPVPGGDLDVPLVHVQQLPEVVALPGEGASGGVFEIVDRVDLPHRQRTAGDQGLVLHGGASFERMILLSVYLF